MRLGEYSMYNKCYLVPVFVNLLRSPEIDFQPGGIDFSESIPGLHKRLQIRAQLYGMEAWNGRYGKGVLYCI
jgi:hypothetical protein